MRPLICMIALLVLSSSQAAEQSDSPQVASAVETDAPSLAGTDPANDVEDAENIIVTGQRRSDLQRLMLDFVVEIGDPVSSNQGYARWKDKICVGVHNLKDQATAQYVADRISLVAMDLGLEPGEPGCRPNVLVIFAPDGRQAVEEMLAVSPNMFRPFGGAGGTTQGLHALKKFRASEAPVRWWQITMIVNDLGNPAVDINDGAGPPVARATGSYIRRRVTDEIWACYVIVDVSKLGNATWPQITDYVAMVSLAQIDPESAPAQDSILNLFHASTPVSGMTDMDRSYLQALYQMDLMLLPKYQRGGLANRMLRVREKDAE